MNEFLEGSKIDEVPSIHWSDIDIPRLKDFAAMSLYYNAGFFFSKITEALVYMQLSMDPKDVPANLRKENILRPKE